MQMLEPVRVGDLVTIKRGDVGIAALNNCSIYVNATRLAGRTCKVIETLGPACGSRWFTIADPDKPHGRWSLNDDALEDNWFRALCRQKKDENGE